MGACPNCHATGQRNSRIPDEIRINCRRNNVGSCSACAKLEDHERKIEEARRALERLLDEREALVFMLNDQHDPFAQRLPVELVLHVFKLSLPFSPSLHVFVSKFDNKLHARSVFKLGHVCQHWRNISQQYPELWTIFTARITRRSCMASAGMVREWLKRSQRLSVYIQFDGCEREDVILHSAREVIRAITPHMHRCRVLDIQTSSVIAVFSFASSFPFLDRIEHLSLGLQDLTSTAPLQLNASPLVLTLQTGQITEIKINWNRLTHFVGPKMEFTYLDECAVLYESAPQLIFSDLGPVSCKFPLSDTPIINSSLRTLLVETSGDYFWDHFTFPALQTLHAVCGSGPRNWNVVKDFLNRSGCMITDLSIDEREKQRLDGVIQVFKAIPKLVHLSARGKIASGSLLSAMTAAINSGGLGFLPELRSLCFSGFSGPFDWSSLLILLTSMGVRRLRSVETIEVQYTELLEVEAAGNGIVMTKDILKQVLEAVEGIELLVVDSDGADLVENMCCHYGI